MAPIRRAPLAAWPADAPHPRDRPFRARLTAVRRAERFRHAPPRTSAGWRPRGRRHAGRQGGRRRWAARRRAAAASTSANAASGSAAWGATAISPSRRNASHPATWSARASRASAGTPPFGHRPRCTAAARARPWCGGTRRAPARRRCRERRRGAPSRPTRSGVPRPPRREPCCAGGCRRSTAAARRDAARRRRRPCFRPPEPGSPESGEPEVEEQRDVARRHRLRDRP